MFIQIPDKSQTSFMHDIHNKYTSKIACSYMVYRSPSKNQAELYNTKCYKHLVFDPLFR